MEQLNFGQSGEVRLPYLKKKNSAADMEKNDRRLTKQVSLPLTFDKSEAKAFIKQHWNLTFARQRSPKPKRAKSELGVPIDIR